MIHVYNYYDNSSTLQSCFLVIYADSGVGAGIDSYYEYCLKGYILLGDEIYLERFNKVSKGILL